MKVRAKGPPDQWVGYYNHLRKRGGDVFSLSDPKHFSNRWMDKVNEDAPETKPAHFNKVGRGDARRLKDEQPVKEETKEEKPTGSSEVI